MKIQKISLAVALVLSLLITVHAEELGLTANPAFVTVGGKRYSVIQLGDKVTFTTSPSIAATFSWTFNNGSPATGSGNGPFDVTYSSAAAQDQVNDVIFSSTRSSTKNGNPITCTTTNKTTADVLVPKVVWNQENATPLATNYIDTGTVVSSGKIKTTTTILINLGVNGITTSTVSTTAARDSADLFSPTSGTTATDSTTGSPVVGVFKTLFTTIDHTDPLDIKFTIPPGTNTIQTSDSHQILPAVYKNTFTITGYTTPQESDSYFGGSSGTTTTASYASIKTYYYITATSSHKLSFLQTVALEGFGYAPSYGGTLLGTSNTVTHPTSYPTGTNSTWTFYNTTIAATTGLPKGNNGNDLHDGTSCAIVRDNSKTGIVVPSSTSTVAALSTTNWGSKNADDKVTGSLTNYHLDLYYVSGYTYSSINALGDTENIVLSSY